MLPKITSGVRSPPDTRRQSGPLWRALGAFLLLAAAGWGWKALFPPDNRYDKLTSSPEDLKKAAMEQVLKEQAEKEKKANGEAGRAAGPPAAVSVPMAAKAPPAALGGPSALPPAPPKPPTLTATKDTPFTNSLGMKFVPVPIGAGPSKDQRILFSIWETRSKDYAAFVKDSGHDAGEDWKTYSYKDVPVGRGEGEKAEDSIHPVANVSHDDGVAFCAWLTKKDCASGQIGPQDEYRLPSDVEWSYAVGIGDGEDANASPKENDRGVKEVYPWGTTFPPPAGSGNYADATAKAKGTDFLGIIEGYIDGHATTAPVGSFKPNASGLYDLGGNLWEWTSTPWEVGRGPRVLRGSSWGSIAESYLLSSIRFNYACDNRNDNRGFRCVLVVSGG